MLYEYKSRKGQTNNFISICKKGLDKTKVFRFCYINAYAFSCLKPENVFRENIYFPTIRNIAFILRKGVLYKPRSFLIALEYCNRRFMEREDRNKFREINFQCRKYNLPYANDCVSIITSQERNLFSCIGRIRVISVWIVVEKFVLALMNFRAETAVRRRECKTALKYNFYIARTCVRNRKQVWSHKKEMRSIYIYISGGRMKGPETRNKRDEDFKNKWRDGE